MLLDSDVELLLDSFPKVEYAIAYGSGVIQQSDYQYKNTKENPMPMVDLILVVDNSIQWHSENVIRNPTHYSPLLPVGPKLIASFQENLPAHLWFNTHVPMNSSRYPNRLMKYGVISKKHTLTDLTTWKDLYIAGRLHKPVHILKNNNEIELAVQKNLEHAIRTSLLLLPEKFTELELYLAVASLSYIGDPRMLFGENPRKVYLTS